MADPLTILSTGGALLDSIGINLSNPFGGSTCSDSQKKQRQKIADAINEYTTYTDRQQFINSLNMESDIAPTGEAMAHFYLGGADCKHKNVGTNDKKFIDRLESWLNRKVAESRTVPETYGDKYSNNTGYSETPPAAATQKVPGPGFFSGLPAWLLPVVLLVLIAFGFNAYQNS